MPVLAPIAEESTNLLEAEDIPCTAQDMCQRSQEHMLHMPARSYVSS